MRAAARSKIMELKQLSCSGGRGDNDGWNRAELEEHDGAIFFLKLRDRAMREGANEVQMAQQRKLWRGGRKKLVVGFCLFSYGFKKQQRRTEEKQRNPDEKIITRHHCINVKHFQALP